MCSKHTPTFRGIFYLCNTFRPSYHISIKTIVPLFFHWFKKNTLIKCHTKWSKMKKKNWKKETMKYNKYSSCAFSIVYCVHCSPCDGLVSPSKHQCNYIAFQYTMYISHNHKNNTNKTYLSKRLRPSTDITINMQNLQIGYNNCT